MSAGGDNKMGVLYVNGKPVLYNREDPSFGRGFNHFPRPGVLELSLLHLSETDIERAKEAVAQQGADGATLTLSGQELEGVKYLILQGSLAEFNLARPYSPVKAPVSAP
ncbi:MAG: hypothetical protein ABIH34_02415 [Nanoarchaeota archaeon]